MGEVVGRRQEELKFHLLSPAILQRLTLQKLVSSQSGTTSPSIASSS